MRRLRSAGTTGSGALLLGLLLALGPLVQSVAARPCSRTGTSGGPDSPAVVQASPAAGSTWICARQSPAAVVRAVSTDRSEPSLDASLDFGRNSGEVPSVRIATTNDGAPLHRLSLVLTTLRPVVLQI